MIDLSGHFHLLIHTLLYGAYLALTFDFLLIICKKKQHVLLKHTLIGLFWMLQIPLILLYFYQVNHGVFQSYLLIFIFFGALCYHKLLKSMFVENLRELVDAFLNIYAGFEKLLTVLFFKPIAFILSSFFSTVKKDETSTK